MDSEQYLQRFYRIATGLEIKRRRIAGVAAVIYHIKNEKKFAKKKYWVAPIFKNRKVSSFYFASVPKLKL